MKRIFLVTLTLSLGLIISACSDGGGNAEQSNNQSQASSVKSMSEEARVSAAANQTDDGRIVVTGETNLPDSTELLISLSNEAVGFTAQDKSAVRNGKFSAGPLGPKSGLTAGNYVIEVMMPVPSVQPESVQSIIGNEGQYLTGPLVKDSSWGGKTVEYSFPYTFGSKESIQQVEAEHAQLVSDVRSRIDQLLKNGRAMEQYRNTDDLAALKTCGERIRENQAKAKAVRSKADTLPMKYFDLKVASVDIYSCVSCLGTAIEACDRVAESLKNAK
ncbi:hypothetical protein [Teredinibacter turnerae]|uniref:hypothetical protein n=1 Tax=Teredinibacter turnerae TaxID=2426 RepID=UPI00040932AF|nr:hypothetical protein [Teredinibacter turnerae]